MEAAPTAPWTPTSSQAVTSAGCWSRPARQLASQLRCAYAFALEQGYQGIVTIDGNDKDDPQAIPRFILALSDGVDFVQASRFVAGGKAENTPLSRDLAIASSMRLC